MPSGLEFSIFLVDTRTSAFSHWQHDSQPTLGTRFPFLYTGFATPHNSTDQRLEAFPLDDFWSPTCTGGLLTTSLHVF